MCALDLTNPRATFASLTRMASVAEREVLTCRTARVLTSDLKALFQHTFIGQQLIQAQRHSEQYVQHVADLLSHVKTAQDASLVQRLQCKKLLRTTINDREQCRQRMLTLEATLNEAKRRSGHLLELLHRCRQSYDTAIAMTELLQHAKMHPLSKSWSAVGTFHTASIATWYDLRIACASDIERLERELQVLARQLARLDDAVEQRRRQWVLASVDDVEACERAAQLQDLVHNAVAQVVALEEHRVVYLLSSFDTRRKWLDPVRLMQLHTAGSRSSSSSSSVNQTLVQLSIARLDAIKQEKRYDLLVRKLRVYERIQKLESEKQQVCASVGVVSLAS